MERSWTYFFVSVAAILIGLSIGIMVQIIVIKTEDSQSSTPNIGSSDTVRVGPGFSIDGSFNSKKSPTGTFHIPPDESDNYITCNITTVDKKYESDETLTLWNLTSNQLLAHSEPPCMENVGSHAPWISTCYFQKLVFRESQTENLACCSEREQDTCANGYKFTIIVDGGKLVATTEATKSTSYESRETEPYSVSTSLYTAVSPEGPASITSPNKSLIAVSVVVFIVAVLVLCVGGYIYKKKRKNSAPYNAVEFNYDDDL